MKEFRTISLIMALGFLFACGTGTTSVRSLESEGCDCSPSPRWVLRDTDGQRVQAAIRPSCGRTWASSFRNSCLPVEFDGPYTYPCILISSHESRSIRVHFDLQTGKIGPCNQSVDRDPNESWFESNLSQIYLDDSCTGPTYKDVNLANLESSRRIHWVEGIPWYASEEGCVKQDGWSWNLFMDSCFSHLPLEDFEYYCPYKPVPDWVQELLPNPPYTVSVEYE